MVEALIENHGGTVLAKGGKKIAMDECCWNEDSTEARGARFSHRNQRWRRNGPSSSDPSYAAIECFV